MEHKKYIILALFLLTILSFSCEKEDEWVQINAVETDSGLAAEMNSIISADNECLMMVSNKSQMQALFTSGSFQALDSCNQVPDIDFANYTLILGRIDVVSMSDKISSVNLSLLDNKYKVEVDLDRCAQCDEPYGFLYFWRIFPKLEIGYSYELFVD